MAASVVSSADKGIECIFADSLAILRAIDRSFNSCSSIGLPFAKPLHGPLSKRAYKGGFPKYLCNVTRFRTSESVDNFLRVTYVYSNKYHIFITAVHANDTVSEAAFKYSELDASFIPRWLDLLQ